MTDAPFTAEDAAFTLNWVLDVKNTYGVMARIAPIASAPRRSTRSRSRSGRARCSRRCSRASPSSSCSPKRYYDQGRHQGHPGASRWAPARSCSRKLGGRRPLRADGQQVLLGRRTQGRPPRHPRDSGPRHPHRLARRPARRRSSRRFRSTSSRRSSSSDNAKMDEIVVDRRPGAHLRRASSPPFDDPRARLAFDYAVDKAAIRQARC